MDDNERLSAVWNPVYDWKDPRPTRGLNTGPLVQ